MERVDNLCGPNKIQFSENTGLKKSVRSASEAHKLYFDNSVLDALVAKSNWYAKKFGEHKDNKTTIPCSQLERF
jgi:hypothetical protein